MPVTIQGVLTLTPEVVEQLKAKLQDPRWVSVVDKRKAASKLVDISRVDGDCWLWQGMTAGGYPVMEVKGKNITVRRLSFLLFRPAQPLGNGTLVSTCRNKMCICPKHLKPKLTPRGGRRAKVKKGKPQELD
jgi:hypothetical protein